MANACCSIEMEPRTLSEGQLSQARQVAADVVQKLVPKEASTIFFNKEAKPNFLMKEEEEEDKRKGQDDKFDVEREEIKIIQVPCQCSNTQSPTELELKEPLSAPF
ncbi:hypothetical protein K2173_024719 [Erythroxylum novogranatense]|uniref:Uncharacterized protein n=1 Tax=Erythroxylum novogranatense TaxID=1862640 RepID=A0AAV8SV28_9ROSI|nr:hypothetical protein K2173_024719 [Erythroxylum novogranatense]